MGYQGSIFDITEQVYIDAGMPDRDPTGADLALFTCRAGYIPSKDDTSVFFDAWINYRTEWADACGWLGGLRNREDELLKKAARRSATVKRSGQRAQARPVLMTNEKPKVAQD